jgi:hypothetical protein
MIRQVLKADGRMVPFSKEKIIETCIRTGVDARKAAEIATWVENNAPDGAPSREIYEMVLQRIEQLSAQSGVLFKLRDVIADLDSESFELYAAKVLESDGWKTDWNKLIKGASVEHQVDVVASKAGETWLVECKRHFNPHRWTGLDVMLQVHARLEDIRDGSRRGTNKYDFTGAWIFTNTKFSDHALQYASAKGIRMTGWRTGSPSLEKLVEPAKAFPVTVLNVDTGTKARLLDAKIITVQDILAARRGPVPNWPEIVKMAKSLIK